MDADDELRLLRDRLADLEGRLAALESAGVPGSHAVACKTVAVSSYPVAGGSGTIYGVQALELTGPEAEGGSAAASVVANTFFAANLGNVLVPLNTEVLVSTVAYKRVFQYYG